MGTVCILIGIIVLALFFGGGFFIYNAILSNSTYASLMGLKDYPSSTVYIIVVSICFVIGLLICLNLVMHGLTYNRANKTYALLKKLSK